MAQALDPDNASILVAGGGGVALLVTRRLKDMGAWVWVLQRSDSRRCGCRSLLRLPRNPPPHHLPCIHARCEGTLHRARPFRCQVGVVYSTGLHEGLHALARMQRLLHMQEGPHALASTQRLLHMQEGLHAWSGRSACPDDVSWAHLCRAQIEGMMAIVVRGDALNEEDVKKAFAQIEEVDVVVSTIGGTPGDPTADSQVPSQASPAAHPLQQMVALGGMDNVAIYPVACPVQGPAAQRHMQAQRCSRPQWLIIFGSTN